MKRGPVLKSMISLGSQNDFIRAIFSLVENRVPSYVCFANVHMLVEANKDKAFQKIINEADVVAPDGKPVSVFLRLSQRIRQERVCGMDIFPVLLQKAEEFGKSVYFYGTTDILLRRIVEKTRARFPLLRIAGYHSPPFKSSLSEEESSYIVGKIREASPDLVFVALGCPKQEKWMAKNKDGVRACLLGLGQAFHVYAGTEKRLPGWMRDFALEWMYRLWQDPARLWKRYALTNSYFLVLVVKHLMHQVIVRIMSLSSRRSRAQGI